MKLYRVEVSRRESKGANLTHVGTWNIRSSSLRNAISRALNGEKEHKELLVHAEYLETLKTVYVRKTLVGTEWRSIGGPYVSRKQANAERAIGGYVYVEHITAKQFADGVAAGRIIPKRGKNNVESGGEAKAG